jgi:type VI secretion system protein VasG
MFIDEAHTMIGAGGAAGQGDAANLLKPALARGELRTVAATTWSEYKKYFEKDPALTRRFQVVKVEEPTEAAAVAMMRGLVATLEGHHNVRVLGEAVDAAVRLSHRYITERQLPDKAVSVLDTTCARVALGQVATPPPIEDCQRRIELITTEIGICERESLTGVDCGERLEALRKEKSEVEGRLATLQAQWEKEKAVVARLAETRVKLEAQAAGKGAALGAAEVERLQGELRDANRELAEVQGEAPLIQPCVTEQAVAEVVSGWTGIPVGKVMKDEIRTIMGLKETLEQRIIGQSHALDAISQRIRTSKAQLADPRRPIGVFLLVGPSGVGKTETAISLADALYGGERNMVVINMSEYQEAHTVSGLKGAPPGYVGFGEGGVLTEAVRRKPYCVVLLDEIEKAHADVLELFYQVFDKGVLEDSEGRVVDFKNTIILMTSNAATDTMMKLCADPDTRPEPDTLVDTIRPELVRVFKPAFLGRAIIVPYYPIGDDIMRRIIELQLGRVRTRLEEGRRTRFTYDPGLIDAIAGRCTEVDSGARIVDHILTRSLLPDISSELLARMANGESVASVHVSAGDGGKFQYRFA